MGWLKNNNNNKTLFLGRRRFKLKSRTAIGKEQGN